MEAFTSFQFFFTVAVVAMVICLDPLFVVAPPYHHSDYHSPETHNVVDENYPQEPAEFGPNHETTTPYYDTTNAFHETPDYLDSPIEDQGMLPRSEYPAHGFPSFPQTPVTYAPTGNPVCCADCPPRSIRCFSTCIRAGCHTGKDCRKFGEGVYAGYCQRTCQRGITAASTMYPEQACRGVCAGVVQRLCANNNCREFGCRFGAPSCQIEAPLNCG